MIIGTAGSDSDTELRATLERIGALLVTRYGTPTDFYETGSIDAPIAAGVESGSFIRLMEWARPEGVLRFGIPRRVDGQIRMELQFARELPPFRETSWSLESVR